MKSIVREDLEVKKSIDGIFKVSLTVTLVAFVVFTISPISDLQAVKPAPNFIMSKTLNDDAAGHSHGWNPDGSTHDFDIIDTDVSTTSFVHLINIEDTGSELICDSGWTTHANQIRVRCTGTPLDGDPLHYIIINVPTQVVTSVLPASSSVSESSPSSPFTTLQAGK